ncbi:MAG: restriction endonuclease, SacI family [Planctomycetota bacterium]
MTRPSYTISTDQAKALLDKLWTKASGTISASKAESRIPDEIRDAIDRSIDSKTKTYRYVLPTQLLAKCIEPDVDCRSVQAGSGLSGAFDARSLCHKVVVPFDHVNNNVLGGSSEPYLNNPLRIPAIVRDERQAQKAKAGFDDLCLVLEYAESHPKTAHKLMSETLSAIRLRMELTCITYAVPNRISLGQSLSLADRFLADPTGGLRLQVVAEALFRSIGERFRLFDQVRSASINAADASTGRVADIECVGSEQQIVLAVEIKDRQLTIRDVEDKLSGIREAGIRELAFLVRGEGEFTISEELPEVLNRHFATGHNIYVCDFRHFLNSCLVLFGEEGRRSFLILLGAVLDDRKADLSHRETWRDLLNEV